MPTSLMGCAMGSPGLDPCSWPVAWGYVRRAPDGSLELHSRPQHGRLVATAIPCAGLILDHFEPGDEPPLLHGERMARVWSECGPTGRSDGLAVTALLARALECWG